MKFSTLSNRLRAMEPSPADPAEKEQVEQDALLYAAWQEAFFKQLTKLDCGQLIDEVKAALQSIGPRPFGHSLPDDHPYWSCIDDVVYSHQDLSYHIRAADWSAWADVYQALGVDEAEVRYWKERAAYELNREAKEKQTYCDYCGCDLTAWSCYAGGQEKICWTCSQHPEACPR